MHEGERALLGDNDGVDSRAQGAATRPVNVVKSPSDKSDERELAASVLRNDRKAAAQLVAAHIDAVYTYARHRLAPHADLVDDVVQDVFLAALKGLATFEGQSSLRTWLVAIARHKIEDIYRHRLRARRLRSIWIRLKTSRLLMKSHSTNRLIRPVRAPRRDVS